QPSRRSPEPGPRWVMPGIARAPAPEWRLFATKRRQIPPHIGQSPARTLLLPDACPISNPMTNSLPDERIALLPLRCVHGARRSRQLQHGCVLAFAHPGEEDGLPVGELQRIVMHARLAHVDLPELCHFLPELSDFHAREKSKKALVLHLLFERDLRAR